MTTFKEIEHWAKNFIHCKGTPKAYEVIQNGSVIGRVEQTERHSYRLAGRLRYGDSYSVKWHAKFPNGDYAKSHRVYADTRKEATRWLLEEIEWRKKQTQVS